MNSQDPLPANESWWRSLGAKWVLVALATILLIAALYAEEDWRGEAAWKQAQAEVTAAGESLDPKKFNLPPIPDDQNFGALPIFQLEPDLGSRSYPPYLSALPMNRAMARVDKFPSSSKDDGGPDQLPYLGRGEKSETADIPAIRKRLSELCRRGNPSGAPPTASLPDMFGILCPALAELRAENVRRPLCQFFHQEADQLPFFRSLSGIVSQIKLAKVLAYQEKLALLDHQPQLALDDLRVSWKIDAGLRKESTLVAGLVSVGVVAIQLGIVEQGLATHSWNAAQLTQLEEDLAKIDFLQEDQLCVRGEAAVSTVPTADYLKTHRSLVRGLVGGELDAIPLPLDSAIAGTVCTLGALLVPNGWFDCYKADCVRAELLGSTKLVDPSLHRVFPEREQAGVHMIQSSKESSIWRNFVFGIVGPLLSGGGKHFAYEQVLVDEARIACGLERFRISRGQYPATLDEINSAQIPNDAMNGRPYLYARQPDGSYLLYSVGWNQTDDKGRVGSRSLGSTQLDDPDWVWPNHPQAEKPK